MLNYRPASAVHWARAFILPALTNGSRAVDATAGNGHDTLFLAEGVGPGGRVYALDIQEAALERTENRIREAGLADRVTLIRGGHQEMESLVGAPVDAVMFNLGYLPGGDREVITRPETTVKGIRAATGMLRPGGRMSVVVYTGHPCALDEAREVDGLLASLDPGEFSVQKVVFRNSRADSPEMFFITRSGGDHD